MSTATLTPSAALEASTSYTATVKGGASGVKDLAGNALAADSSWSFTTGTGGGMSIKHGERIYNYRGVHGFKNKFRPTWEPRFMAYQRPWDWASAVITTTSLIWARTPQDRRRIERARSGM